MSRWQLAEDANVTDEARKEINEYIDKALNNKNVKVVVEIPKGLKIIYGSCSNE